MIANGLPIREFQAHGPQTLDGFSSDWITEIRDSLSVFCHTYRIPLSIQAVPPCYKLVDNPTKTTYFVRYIYQDSPNVKLELYSPTTIDRGHHIVSSMSLNVSRVLII